ncbi:hypothetical protein LXL04_003598 [Taraxacum kok-saghyz]
MNRRFHPDSVDSQIWHQKNPVVGRPLVDLLDLSRASTPRLPANKVYNGSFQPPLIALSQGNHTLSRWKKKELKRKENFNLIIRFVLIYWLFSIEYQVFDHLPLEGSTTKQHKPQVSKNAAAKQQNKTLQKLPKKPPKGRAKWSKKHSTTRMNQAAEQPLKRSRTSQILAVYEHTRKRQHPHQRRTTAQPTARDRRAPKEDSNSTKYWPYMVSDPELEAIRQRRMQELMAQHGGGGDP